MDAQPSRLSATAIFAGSFICFGLISVFALFSGAIGLTGSDFKWGLFLPVLALVIVIPFYGAGWAAARAAGGSSRYLHALTVWAVVTATLGFAIGTRATELGSAVLKQLGIAAGAKVGGHAVIEQLAELRPRLETKVHLKEGKAVTSLAFGGRAGSLTNELRQAAKEEAKETVSGGTSSASERDELAEDLKTVARTTTWAALAALLVALFAALMGARQVAVRRRHQPRV